MSNKGLHKYKKLNRVKAQIKKIIIQKLFPFFKQRMNIKNRVIQNSKTYKNWPYKRTNQKTKKTSKLFYYNLYL